MGVFRFVVAGVILDILVGDTFWAKIKSDKTGLSLGYYIIFAGPRHIHVAQSQYKEVRNKLTSLVVLFLLFLL